MNMSSDCVLLDVKTYNKIKTAQVRADLVIDRLFELAHVSRSPVPQLVFNSDNELTELMMLAYPDRYRNVLDQKLKSGT